METGRIIKIISNQYEVLDENGNTLLCVAMGKLRKAKSPVVGDLVEFQKFDDQIGIQKILTRKNELQRPAIANVDQAIIVMSCVNPDFSTTLIDRLIFLIALAKIEPILCITKADLISVDSEIYKDIEDYKRSGYEVYITGEGFDTANLKQLFKGKISVLTGQSGAGKSSLINRLDASFTLRTQEISKALGRGKHTTRHSQLHEVCNGWIADTPGFSSLDFSGIDIHELASAIQDFDKAAKACKFRDCIHINEPDCGVLKGIENNEVSSIRYIHYKKVVEIIQKIKLKY